MIFSASKRTQEGEEVEWEGAVERTGRSHTLRFSHVPAPSSLPLSQWDPAQGPEGSAAKPPAFSAGTHSGTLLCLGPRGEGRGSTTVVGMGGGVLELGCTTGQPLFTFLLLPLEQKRCARTELGRMTCGLWLVASSLGLPMASLSGMTPCTA